MIQLYQQLVAAVAAEKVSRQVFLVVLAEDQIMVPQHLLDQELQVKETMEVRAAVVPLQVQFLPVAEVVVLQL
jgi:hypothetical protein